ncbi:MAG TPA: glycosyltransferase [Micromonosporaceae bacterium]|nr:glycosyltransferase [Micromonosporaceae bacterium]
MRVGEQPRVLVVGAPFGDGHMTAAKAVARLLAIRGPGLAVTVTDICGNVLPRLHLDRALRAGYRTIATHWGGRAHRLLYGVAGRWPGAVCRLSYAALGRSTRAWLRRAAPDLVIATHPVAAYLCRRAVGPRVPVVTLVTDSGAVNPIWFHGRYAATLLADAGSVHHIPAGDGPPPGLAVVGSPVAMALTRPPGQREARARLGLDERFTVLVTAGGAGLGRGIRTAARALASSDLDIQLILNAGDNGSLLRGFRAIARRRTCVVRGFTDEFDLLLAASDLVVGKAGWLTLNEAILLGRPTLIVDVLPGQEESNAVVAEALGVARRVPPATVVDEVRRYAGDRRGLAADFALDAAAEFVAGWPDRLVDALSQVLPAGAVLAGPEPGAPP